MSLHRELRDKVEAALVEAGARVTGYRQTGASKQRFDFEVDGRRGFHIFACTPGQSFRVFKNNVAIVRRKVRALRAQA